jgi:hypothetical protein
MKHLLMATALATGALWLTPANAVPLTLLGPIQTATLGPQSTSNPCVIAGTQCQQPAGFGFNNFVSGGNISAFNAFSTTPTAVLPDGVQGTPYTVAQIEAVVGTSFLVAIDVTPGVTVLSCSGAVNVACLNFVGPRHCLAREWFWGLEPGTIDLTGLAATDTVLFHAVWNGAVDGAESYFLVSTNPTPPPKAIEPASMLILGTGLIGLAAFARRKPGGHVA